jgi:hypothetical protein
VLSDDLHLASILFVRCQRVDLFANRRAGSAAGGGLPEGRSDGFGVRQTIASNDLESRDGGVIEPNVKRARHHRTVAQFVLQRANCPP